jgi:hypothetical protein
MVRNGTALPPFPTPLGVGYLIDLNDLHIAKRFAKAHQSVRFSRILGTPLGGAHITRATVRFASVARLVEGPRVCEMAIE